VFKNAIFQLHWLFGITAGLVLSIVGLTGSIYSFEGEILQAINPQSTQATVLERGPLATAEVLPMLAEAGGKAVGGLWLSTDPGAAARVMYNPEPDERRGAMRYFDPYTGALLPDLKGEAFFALMFRLHRWLAMGDVGKQITAGSTVALIFFCLSGLYLRWPRQVASWRAWLTLDWARKGRSFNWDLHSVLGTWCLLLYLLASLTALWWSYDWYRDGVNRLLAEGPSEQRGGPGGGGRGGPGGRGPALPEGPAPYVDYPNVLAVLKQEAGATLTHYTLRLPMAAGQPVSVSYFTEDSPHERAANQLQLDAISGQVRSHQRWDDKRFKAQIQASIYPLHVGSYFGMTGRILMMVASALLPLFFITGWLLYLDRRRKKRAMRAARGAVTGSLIAPAERQQDWLIGFASQSGVAEQLAWQTAGQLQAAGHGVDVRALATLDAQTLGQAQQALFVVSTFGDGEAPDSARGFERRVLGQAMALPGLRYAVLALGDRQYAQFCGFARRLHSWLDQQGASRLFAPVEVDNGDAAALQQWQHELQQLGIASSTWQPAQWHTWRLDSRRVLNPGSAGAPVYQLGLTPADHATASWQAGDLVDVLPRNCVAAVQAWLQGLGVAADAPVQLDGLDARLAQALAGRQLPSRREHLVGLHAQALVDALLPLAAREYSIASIAADGVLELLVRQESRADGSLGLGSGWLTAYLPQGAGVSLRLRRNRAFHLPDDDRPLLLIGNGTGLAGLRSLLKARIAAGQTRNWLLFGERNAAHDGYYHDELQGWLASGDLTRLDVAFSRDQAQKIYVQDRLREAAAEVQAWLEQGASIYVCGSLDGMAEGVEQVLLALLGVEGLQRLSEAGRYRRDVY